NLRAAHAAQLPSGRTAPIGLISSGWCGRAGLSPLPATPATVRAYLSARAGELKVAALNRRIAAITVVHRTAGLGLDGGPSGDRPGAGRHLPNFNADYGQYLPASWRSRGTLFFQIGRMLPFCRRSG